MSRAPTSRLALGVAFALSFSVACKAQDGVLDAIFECNPEAGDAQCGTDENGEPMTCYVGSAQLGGQAFCTKRCDPTRKTDPGSHCTSSGALLATCQPNQNDVPCQSPLNCYRTDVFVDEGLCLLVPICPSSAEGSDVLDDRQCGISHPECAGDLLRTAASESSLQGLVQTSNLHCVRNCRNFACASEGLPEVCPSDFYTIDFGLPISCASPCDRFSCPPNFSCAASAGPGSPPLCLPGMPGVRCTNDDDCLVGVCLDTGAGFSQCTLPLPCDSDDDCLALGTNPSFLCAEGLPGGGRYCVSPIPFHGENCQTSDECSAELRCGSEACPPRFCSKFSVYQVAPERGDCRFDCDPAVGCPAFGGLPHACLEDGSCHPGTFGVPCKSSADCVSKLSCRTLPPDDQSRTDGSICTAGCDADADCLDSPWLGAGYCVDVPDPPSNARGYCRLARQNGRLCEKPAHCLSGNCVMQEGGSMLCEEAP